MFVFALLIGVYSYVIFFLGILGWLYEWVIVGMTVGFVGLSLKFVKEFRVAGYALTRQLVNPLTLIFAFLFALQAGVNLIGVLGPELGFDALWYHLTLPKLYLINHSIDFIPGGLLYYSAMPKLAEMLYTAGLSLGNENFVKFIHYLFGLLTCLAIYKLSRIFLNSFFSLIAVVIFYSNLVVGWESTSAYIDLVRAFFEVMALWAFVEWGRGGSYKWFTLSALMVGLAITTKLLAIGSLMIFSLILIVIFMDSRLRGNDKEKRTKFVNLFIGLFVYWIIALVVPMPWFVFSYLHTGNPVYPFFTDLYAVSPEPLSLFNFIREVWILFTQASDPVSLVYVLFLPVIGWMIWKGGVREVRNVGIVWAYCFLAIVIWYFTPRTGGGRFILPYLPALSILCAIVLKELQKKRVLYRFLITIIIVVSLFSIGYRSAANSKYIPVIIGTETKAEFLEKRLHFDYGDFYDVDGFFAKTITSSDKVLLLGFHNLYYVNFPFVEASWVKEEDNYTYIAVQKGELPDRYKDWKLVYENKKTMVKLYKDSRHSGAKR